MKDLYATQAAANEQKINFGNKRLDSILQFPEMLAGTLSTVQRCPHR
jgi:hypothetical protein